MTYTKHQLTQFVFFVVTIMAALTSVSAFAKDTSAEAQAWLNKMAMSSEKLNYSGIVSYQYGDVLVSAKMSQKVVGGKKHARLEYLDGNQSGYIGADDKVMFINGKKPKSPVKGELRLVESNIKSLSERLAKLGKTYRLKMGANHKIAGRDAVVVEMQPSDPFRYAHRLFIDKDTALLLKTETIGDSAVLLERFQFVQLDLNAPTPIEHFQLSLLQAKQSFVRKMKVIKQENSQDTLDWRVSWVPKGYNLVSSNNEGSSRSTCLYTDGMSSFSVYVEPMTSRFKAGKIQQGASVVLSQSASLKNKPAVITVAGDIPIATAERIIQSVRGINE